MKIEIKVGTGKEIVFFDYLSTISQLHVLHNVEYYKNNDLESCGNNPVVILGMAEENHDELFCVFAGLWAGIRTRTLLNKKQDCLPPNSGICLVADEAK
jgi:hypothetical protein